MKYLYTKNRDGFLEISPILEKTIFLTREKIFPS